jgi:hypothetical protein
MRKVCGRPPKFTREQAAQLREWDRQRRAIPSMKKLCSIYGVNEATILRAIRGQLKHYRD